MQWDSLLGRRGFRAAMMCALALSIVGGCKVGPNYQTPPVPLPSNWIDYQNPRVTNQEQDLSRWWTVFRDPVLDSLIAEAYQQNLSLRAAGARIVEARARRGIAVGDIFPQVQEV